LWYNNLDENQVFKEAGKMKPILRKLLKYFAVATWLVTLASAATLAAVYVFDYFKNFRLTAKKIFGILKVLMEL
jgi:hypothetical protein